MPQAICVCMKTKHILCLLHELSILHEFISRTEKNNMLIKDNSLRGIQKFFKKEKHMKFRQMHRLYDPYN